MIILKYKMMRLASLCLLLLVTASLNAKELLDVQLDESIQIEGVEKSLLLNGAGIRYKFFFKIYIGALYLAEKNEKAGSILQSEQASRMLMHFIYDEVPREKLVSGWIEGFENNLAADEMGKLRQRLETFNSMFTDMHSGDIVLLDYLPGKGTRVSIKGQEKGIIEGADFNRALLSVWLGEEPVTEELKDALLGKYD